MLKMNIIIHKNIFLIQIILIKIICTQVLKMKIINNIPLQNINNQ